MSNPLLGVGGSDAAFMVQYGVVHLLRDEMSCYKGSTILKQNPKKGGGKLNNTQVNRFGKVSKKGGGKLIDNQVNRFGKVSKPPKKGYYRCGQPHRVTTCFLPYATPVGRVGSG